MTQKQDEPILQFFMFGHLPKALAEVSAPFCSLAIQIVETLPRNPERSVALRKLLEAKDAAVRAAVFAAAPTQEVMHAHPQRFRVLKNEIFQLSPEQIRLKLSAAGFDMTREIHSETTMGGHVEFWQE